MSADHIDPSPQGELLDEAALLRLVALAGPADGPELMRRLIADLLKISVGLTAGFASHDRKALRQHCHDLLAIAGTIGAVRICQLSKGLYQADKDGMRAEGGPQAVDGPQTSGPAQATELLQRLPGLIQRLQTLSGPLGMA